MSGSSEPHKFCLWAKKYPVCKRTYKRNVDDTKLKKKNGKTTTTTKSV